MKCSAAVPGLSPAVPRHEPSLRKSPKPLIKTRFIAWTAVFTASVLIFSSCAPGKNGADVFDPADFTPTKAPGDWIAIASGSRYRETESLAADKIPASRIELPDQTYSNMVQPLPDGGCIAVSLQETASADSGSQASAGADASGANPTYYLRATAYNQDGKTAWDKTYKDQTFRGYPLAMCVFDDGGFAVSLEISLPDVAQAASVDVLYYFSPDGELLWKSAKEQTVQGCLEYLFAAPDHAVLCAGTVSSYDNNGVFSGSDIRLMRFEKDGTLSKQVFLSMPQNDNLISASYAPAAGLVLSWRTEVTDDPVIAEISYNQVSQVECFNEDLSKNWICVMNADESAMSVLALPDGRGALAYVSRIVAAKGAESAENASENSSESVSGSGAQESVQTSYEPLLVCFSNTGVRLWDYEVGKTNAWLVAAQQLRNGRIAGGWYQNGIDGADESTVFILSSDGKLEKELPAYPGVLQQIAATSDGGFTLVLRQVVSSLPQPPYISSIWQDTEAIVAHYDGALNLVWQRKIDQYKHALRADNVIAGAKDNLLIG